MKNKTPLQVLEFHKTLTPAQKSKIRAQWDKPPKKRYTRAELLLLLLNGPVLTDEQLRPIEEARKDIIRWKKIS